MKNTKKIIGKNIPLVDLLAQYKSIERKIDKVVKETLNSGWYILGNNVLKFEKNFAKYIGVKYSIALASGTDALTIAIKSLNLKESDEVIMPANVYPTAFGIALSGLKIKFVDVDPQTLNLNIENIQKHITKKTKVIIAIHLYGNPVDILPIKKFAKKNNIFLIEDCAQSTGSIYKGKKVGSFGDISCFSFYPTKNLGAYGDGGMILTNNKSIYKMAKLLRTYGEVDRYNSILAGQNSRLDEIQAAILDVKLLYLDKWNKKRQSLANLYRKKLAGLPIEITMDTPNSLAVYHLFTIRIPQREQLMKHLKLHNIGSGIHYPIPVHLVPGFKSLGYKKGDFPISEKACNEILSLPLYPEMSLSDVEYVSEVIRKFYK